MIKVMEMQRRRKLDGCIHQLRVSAGLTQAVLAKLADIGRVTMVRLERGEQSPKLKTLVAIAFPLGIAILELFVEPKLILQ